MTGFFPEGPPPPPYQVLADLLAEAGLDPGLADTVALTGNDPVLPSSFAVGTMAQTSIAAVAAAGLGRIEGGHACPAPTAEAAKAFLETSESGFGRLEAIRHAAQMSRTPTHWEHPAVPLGSHPARWLPQP